MTMDLFEKPSNSPEQIELPDAELLYWPHFFRWKTLINGLKSY